MLNIPLTRNAAIHVRYFFLFFPSYEIGECLLDISRNYYINSVFGANISYFSWDVAGKNLTFMSIEAIGYFLLTLFIETNDFYFDNNDTSHINQSISNNDAIAEANRVEMILQNENERENFNVITHQLTKVYNYNLIAVKKLSLAIKKGEIFGLLGKNGSGKSTLCSILTCEKRSTSGMISICGHGVDHEETKLSIGYCPQTDTIFETLTVLETLEFYGNIRMIPKDILIPRIYNLIEKLKLGKFINTISGNLSGGNKRKLSLAISLIGNPKLLCIDECSSGMDSYAMRSMWQCISSLVKENNSLSIIITTHSMEEAEALCNRIGILKNGEFVCIGTVQELKNKYELGYIIDIIFGESLIQSNALAQNITAIIANIIIVEIAPLSLKLQLIGRGDEIIHNLSAIFEYLEKKKEEYSIISYSVNQVNFEEVFNKASE
jgi:ABC-type multidrug transport system ATPase subunit